MYKNTKLTRLDEVMKERDITTTDLASRMGKSIAYINNIRHGHTTVSIVLLYSLAEHIGCKAIELIVGYDDITCPHCGKRIIKKKDEGNR